MNILVNHPRIMFAPADTVKDISIKANECFTPALIDPSPSLPIVSPVKKPCINIKYKKAFESCFWSTDALDAATSEKLPPPIDPISDIPETIGSIWNCIIKIITMKTKNIIYPWTTRVEIAAFLSFFSLSDILTASATASKISPMSPPALSAWPISIIVLETVILLTSFANTWY